MRKIRPSDLDADGLKCKLAKKKTELRLEFWSWPPWNHTLYLNTPSTPFRLFLTGNQAQGSQPEQLQRSKHVLRRGWQIQKNKVAPTEMEQTENAKEVLGQRNKERRDEPYTALVTYKAGLGNLR